MDREELLNLLTEIGTIDDGAERRSKITKITETLNSVYDTNETLTASNTKLEDDKKKLQAYNMELYLQVAQPPKKSNEQPEPPREPRTFENLFNEKGELKQ